MDHLISLLVQLPKQETVKSAENKITLVICIKHCLELVETLRENISSSKNPLLSTFYKVNNLSLCYSIKTLFCCIDVK